MAGTQEPAAARPVVPGYRLGELLGTGATGSVWQAVRERDAAGVAVKVVPVPAGGPEAMLAARELGVLASVEVEGLVAFHEAFGLRSDPPAVAIVLDLVTGGSLQRAVGARGHLSAGESVTVLAPVARALAGLHAAGVVHGDVSPTNVLLERSGRPLLADLGVARLAGEQPGELFGTAGFVAPEVLDGAAPTPASDVYAVGALAWWCVTGGAPGPAALRRPLEELAPGLPEAWRAATTAALRGVPQERPSAADLALAYFDAAPCEPLRLVVGTDETSLLTARLRSAAPLAELAAPGPASGTLRLPRMRVPSMRLPGREAARRGAALVAALVAVVAVTSLVLDRPQPPWARAAEAPPPGRSSPAATGHGPVGGGATASSTGPAHPSRALAFDHDSAVRHPRGLMQELSDLRAHAMNTGSSSDLAALDAPGSPALGQDTADLERLRGSGRAYSGVGLRVRSATALAVTGDRARVRAVVDTTAYQVVWRSGTQAQPARPGEPMRFTLRWDGTRWQVERVDRG
jgi:serine/threonine protein kinase